MDYGREALADALAAEYVAGTLRGAARRRFERLVPAHPVMQQALLAWQARLIPLAGAIEPVPPPDHVWQGIERRLWPAVNDTSAAAAVPWWQRVGWWRALAGAGGAAALAMAVLFVNPPPTAAPIVVVLERTDSAPDIVPASAIVASFTADGRALTMRPVQRVGLPAQRALELWSVPNQGAPTSLGVIASEGMSVIPRERLTASLLGGQVAALAVSVEPPGGSPTGAPTGPIVYMGKLQL